MHCQYSTAHPILQKGTLLPSAQARWVPDDGGLLNVSVLGKLLPHLILGRLEEQVADVERLLALCRDELPPVLALRAAKCLRGSTAHRGGRGVERVARRLGGRIEGGCEGGLIFRISGAACGLFDGLVGRLLLARAGDGRVIAVEAALGRGQPLLLARAEGGRSDGEAGEGARSVAGGGDGAGCAERGAAEEKPVKGRIVNNWLCIRIYDSLSQKDLHGGRNWVEVWLILG